MLNRELENRRNEYLKGELHEEDMPAIPLILFSAWLEEAIRENIPEPTAMALSTSTPEGLPSSRMVLLKEFSAEGFVFYSHFASRKGLEMENNPYAALLFFWPALERQVRIEGTVRKVSPETSDAYFHSRPEESQIGAWASPQSQPIVNREELVERVEKTKAQFRHAPLTRPPFWGGYMVIPHSIEFWQGRANRLHDRLKYLREGEQWKIVRLAP